jgi:hypothetical protein
MRAQVCLDLDQPSPPDLAVVLADQQLAAEVACDLERVANEEVLAEQAAWRSLYAPAAPVRRAA